MGTSVLPKKKFFVINFHSIRKSENEFLRMRHAVDRLMFNKVSESFDVRYLKLKDRNCIITEPGGNEVFFEGKHHFFYVPRKLYAYLKQHKPDIIFIHGFVFPFQLLWMRFFISGDTRMIVQHHAEKVFTNAIKQWFQRISYSHADSYLFAAKELARDYLTHRIIKEEHRIHEAMETSSSFRLLDKASGTNLIHFEKGPVLLWVGRLNANKDPFTVLKAMHQLKKEGAMFRLYMFYGSAELEPELKTYIHEHRLGEEIFLMGKLPYGELENWYNAADYFISASHYEGSGVALCEALACGCTPIVTDIPSFRMMTGNGAIGHLFEVGNAEDLYKKLRVAFSKNAEAERKKIRCHFERYLSFGAISQKIYDLATSQK